MKKILCSFGDQKYYGSLKLLEKSAYSIGKIDSFIGYTKEWLINEPFYSKNSFILNMHRGAGYWIWKPYIILKTMESLNEGDIVMYSDAAVEVINDLTPLYDIAATNINDGKVIFRLAGKHKNKTWTKRDCFVLMDCDKEEYWDTIQTTASYSLWVKNDKNIEFLSEYQKYLKDSRIVTDLPNICGKPNLMGFKDHRHDQSVLSIMTIRNKYERYRDPSQYGNEEISEFSNSPYPQLFNHHRKKIVF